jgi:phytanoyl-CoA hydroxylase
MRYERNVFDDDEFLKNPIFNVQDLDTAHFGQFRGAALDILTSAEVCHVASQLLDGKPKLIQSMFFEAAAHTWPHQDSYYQDSARALGGAVAGWFALEDIDAGAGRFYVCPHSHAEQALVKNNGELNFANGHERYKDAMVRLIAEHSLPIRAPYLGAGDVLFWSSLTIHGSLAASRPGRSRTSLTAHYLRESDELLQFHSRIRAQQMSSHNGVPIGLLHDQSRLRNRLVREVAFRFPRPYALARNLALRTVIRKERAAMS